MSLAGMLLKGTSVMEAATDEDIKEIEDKAADVENKIHVSEESTADFWTDSALESLLTDIYNVDKAYHTADIIAEVKVIREGADASVLLEGIVGGGIAKIKAAFKAFWTKLKAWFAAVKRQLRLIFAKGKDFVKEFRKEIDRKSVKGFTYNGRKFAISDGDAKGDAIFSAVEAEVNKLTNWTADTKMTAADVNKDTFVEFLKGKGVDLGGNKDDITSTEYQDQFIKTKLKSIVNASDISELTEGLTEIYHAGNDADETESFDDFEGRSKDAMMDHIDGLDKALKAIEKDEKEFDKMMNKIIKAYDSIEKKDVGGNDTAYKQAQYASRAITALLAVGKVPSTVKQAMYKQAAAQDERVLKSFLRWKPAKESVEVPEETNGLLEQAMSMLF